MIVPTKKKRRPMGYWSEETVVKEIRARVKNEQSLNFSVLRKEDNGLYVAASKTFDGGMREAVAFAGFDYDEYHTQNVWSEKKIIDQITEHYNKGFPISSKAMQKQDKNLYNACITHFGNYGSAIAASGYDYQQIRIQQSLSKQDVHTRLLKRVEKGLLLNDDAIQSCDTVLYRAMYTQFGTFQKAIESMGLDYASVRLSDIWDESKIIEILQSRAKEDKILNSSYMRYHHPNLIAATCMYFGSYRKACESAGIDYNSILTKDFSLSKTGLIFEYFLGELLSELKIIYTKGYNDTIRPDFVLPNNQWMDAKLSEWTEAYSTIKKYEPLCEGLTLVYLRGDKKSSNRVSNKTKKISVYQLISRLPKEKRETYIQEANWIWSYADDHKNLDVKYLNYLRSK